MAGKDLIAVRESPDENTGRKKICTECQEENPENFERCWKCSASLAGIEAVDAPESGEKEKEEHEKKTPKPVVQSSLDRKTLMIELGIVLMLCWVSSIMSLVFLPTQPYTSADSIVSISCDLGLIVLIAYLIWRDTGSMGALGLKRCNWRRELLFGACLCGVMFIVKITSGAIAFGFSLPVWETDVIPQEESLLYTVTVPLYLLASALFEEIFFRGYLLVRLTQLFKGRTIWALVISTILFTAVHGYSPSGSFNIFIFGFVLGLFFLAHRSLPRLVLAHWGVNLITLYVWG